MGQERARDELETLPRLRSAYQNIDSGDRSHDSGAYGSLERVGVGEVYIWTFAR